MTRPRKNPCASRIRTPDLPLPRRTPKPLGQRGGLNTRQTTKARRQFIAQITGIKTYTLLYSQLLIASLVFLFGTYDSRFWMQRKPDLPPFDANFKGRYFPAWLLETRYSDRVWKVSTATFVIRFGIMTHFECTNKPIYFFLMQTSRKGIFPVWFLETRYLDIVWKVTTSIRVFPCRNIWLTFENTEKLIYFFLMQRQGKYYLCVVSKTCYMDMVLNTADEN